MTPTTADSDQIVRDHLDKWAKELVDLSKRNRLLYFKHRKGSSFEFDQGASEVLGGLGGRGNSTGWGLFLPPEPELGDDDRALPAVETRPAADELVVAASMERTGAQIQRGLKNLASEAQAEFLDSGLWVLYLGLGALRWRDQGDVVTSPLYLLPVALTQRGPEKAWRLVASEDGEPAVNPSLAVKLETDYGIALPRLDELEDDSYQTAIDAVRAAVADTDWTVDETAVLTTFVFQKEVIYNDLVTNADTIAAHPLVQLLALGPTSDIAADLSFAPDPDEGLDDLHPPEDLAFILNADGTQRQCLLAARQGKSFVMDGPPGTGKSQTIANVIAQLLRDGKTVLFVSEKAAALEVVQNRLHDVGLEPFVLALHSHKATRKAVAQELGEALLNAPQATSRFSAAEKAQLRHARENLTSYAVAVNEVRQPLDRSIHDAIGRTAQLDELPTVPALNADMARLTADDFASLVDQAGRLGRAWGPVARGDDFLWRDLTRTGGTSARESDLRLEIGKMKAAFDECERLALAHHEELRLEGDPSPGGLGDLVLLLGLIGSRPPVGELWLTEPSIDPISASIRALADDAASLAEQEAALAATAPRWCELDPDAADRLESLLAGFGDHAESVMPLTAFDVGEIVTGLESAVADLDQLSADASLLTNTFGADPSPTIHQVERLALLAVLAESPTRPEVGWLDPVSHRSLVDACGVLTGLVDSYRTRRKRLNNTFTENVLELDLVGLKARFSGVHTGVKKLGGAYRTDKRALAATTLTGKCTKETIARLDDAIEWQELSHKLDRAEVEHGARLGDYYSGRIDTDLDRIERALAVTQEALSHMTDDLDIAAVETQLTGQASPQLLSAARRAQEIVGRLTEQSANSASAEVLATGLELSIDNARPMLQASAERCGAVRAEVEQVDRVVGRSMTTADAVALCSQRADAHELTTSVMAAATSGGEHLGALAYEPDADAVRGACDWIDQVRQLFGGALRPRTAAAVMNSTADPGDLDAAKQRLDLALDGLLTEFGESQAAVMREDLAASFEGATELLDALEETVADIHEWSAYSQARAELIGIGLEPQVSACERQRVAADQVAEVCERAILLRWVDQIIEADSRLQPTRSLDRDQLHRNFRMLDNALIHNAAADIINACRERRPRSAAGGAGVIQQQAQLKRRHKPVRTLLTEAGDAAQRVKPCFMMSPLSVSQFLPPSIRFDVVIFDEASQVKESDAVCCVYRGDQLIVAGDQRQLPPTSFFDRMTDTDDDEIDDIDLHDFESVLDRCKAQGFTPLPLSWHYRSRHEDLITYSNHSFYDGRLHTFPSADFDSADLGVELFKVNGVYRRGSTRDNPVEAAEVVDRILFHRRNHPELSIGVVALSTAQQSAVEAEIEKRSESEPELRDLETDDRLDGFFVKNLESVQGDERDIIILTIGYGPDQNGKLTMNFGPMNRTGGERRLNVAVTRARRRMEVVSSIGAEQIRSEKPSINHLRRYLDYAERGTKALALDLEGSLGDAESPFEEEVIRSVQRIGYEPVPQVGVAGYRIDIGVVHPSKPGSYVFGIECDGATYHGSKVARDRDRLRQEVLEGLGWTIHRIWSTAWFTDRATEERRLADAIDLALDDRGPATTPVGLTVERPVVEFMEHDLNAPPDWADAYEEPVAPHPPRSAGVEFTDPSARELIAGHVHAVVEQAGPLHRTAALRAVREGWGLKRSGAKIQRAFAEAVALVVRRGEVEEIGEFLGIPDRPVRVRVPPADDSGKRPVAEVSSAERQEAIVRLLEDAGSSEANALREHWARLFGWSRAGADIVNAFEDALDDLITAGTIEGPDTLRLRT